jgi:hypothetical protein
VWDIKKPNEKVKKTALISEGAYDIGMFRFHWDKATTRVGSAVARPDLEDIRAKFAGLADETLQAAEELGVATRKPPVEKPASVTA